MDESFVSGVTALAGGGQSAISNITATMTRVTTVATASDSVTLPRAAGGLRYKITNKGANVLAVFPFLGDAINAQAVNTSFLVPVGAMVEFVCVVSGTWDTIAQPDTYAGAVTALAGGGQSAATNITAVVTRVATVATAGDSLTLPKATVGQRYKIANAAAANSMNVFPLSGDTINALSANTAIAMAAAKSAEFICIVAGNWTTFPTVPS